MCILLLIVKTFIKRSPLSLIQPKIGNGEQILANQYSSSLFQDGLSFIFGRRQDLKSGVSMGHIRDKLGIRGPVHVMYLKSAYS